MYTLNIKEKENELRYLERVQSKLSKYEEAVSDEIDILIYKLEKEIAILKIIRFIKNNQYKIKK
jgi:predicted nucleotidyltransferase